MGFQFVLALHLLITALVVVSFLCGHWPIFEGTPVQKINYFITVGAHDFLLRLAEVICGARGRNAFMVTENYCCERPNPILQILYVMTLGVTYFVALKSALPYVPGYYVSEKHCYASVVGVLVGILLFIITSFSDPGTINSENASKYLSAYSFDGVIYTQKQCPTCNIPRPARSKHCSICDHCVARFDHHCGWMNNCIGEKNLRYFLAFLLWHVVLCLYGSAVLMAIIIGQWKEQRLAHILTVYYGIENSFTQLAPHFIQWALGFFHTHVLLVIFLAVLSLLLAGFFGYHVYLVMTNMTTNETFKWDNYKMWHLSVTQGREGAEQMHHGTRCDVTMEQDCQGNSDLDDSKCRFLNLDIRINKLYARWKSKRHCSLPGNAYDKGMMHNIREVVYPLSCRRTFNVSKTD